MIGAITRRGNPPCIRRTSPLSRRTITSSSAFRPATGTPRVKRAGSSSSSSVEKLFEWPLCGVAERNSRCSNRPPTSRTARVNCVSIPYRPPLDGAAWCASSRISRLPGCSGPSHSRRGSAQAGSISRLCETRKRLCVRHGLTPNPRSRRIRARYARSSVTNSRPNRSSISACHCSRTDAGAATTIVFAFLRSSSSRAISPASIVLPSPVSSAMNRLTRGRRSAFRSGSIW